jgi:hypothetical protein
LNIKHIHLRRLSKASNALASDRILRTFGRLERQ